MLGAVAGGGVGLTDKLTPFFRKRIGDRFGDRPLPEAEDADALMAASSFSGDGEDPVPVAELRRELASPTVVSK